MTDDGLTTATIAYLGVKAEQQ